MMKTKVMIVRNDVEYLTDCFKDFRWNLTRCGRFSFGRKLPVLALQWIGA